MPSAKTIFIADDDRDDVQFFKEALKAECENMIGLETTLNGTELLQKLEDCVETPDIIFLDINMPGLNGLECLKKIKSRKEWHDIRVVMHSTTNETSTIRRSYEMGADLYVVKAADFNDICMIIRKCVYYDWTGPDFYDDYLKRFEIV
jgi:DNA-binding NarL/FixJ family response regulator